LWGLFSKRVIEGKGLNEKKYQPPELVWTCNAQNKKFRDSKMHFESLWTQMTALQKVIDKKLHFFGCRVFGGLCYTQGPYGGLGRNG
jgi:hypothetical protein